MLSMDYFDRDGNKWSIENGDWKSHQSKPPSEKKRLPKFKVSGFALLFLVVAVVIAFMTIN
jgi:hypothetical protein